MSQPCKTRTSGVRFAFLNARRDRACALLLNSTIVVLTLGCAGEGGIPPDHDEIGAVRQGDTACDLPLCAPGTLAIRIHAVVTADTGSPCNPEIPGFEATDEIKCAVKRAREAFSVGSPAICFDFDPNNDVERVCDPLLNHAGVPDDQNDKAHARLGIAHRGELVVIFTSAGGLSFSGSSHERVFAYQLDRKSVV